MSISNFPKYDGVYQPKRVEFSSIAAKQEENKAKIFTELNRSYVNFINLFKAFIFSLKNAPSNPQDFLELFSTAIVFYSRERIEKGETSRELNQFLENARPTQEKSDYKTESLEDRKFEGNASAVFEKSSDTLNRKRVSLTLNEINSIHQLKEVINHPDYKNVTVLNLDSCSLGDGGWAFLILSLPLGLKEFTINNTYPPGNKGDALGKKLGKLGIVRFAINLPFWAGHAKDAEVKQKGLRHLWKAFGQSDLKHLKSMEITNELLTGEKEWNLTALILYKSLKHGHILNPMDFGYFGEINHHFVKDWLESAMVVHVNLLIKSISKDQLKQIPVEKWESYDQLRDAIQAISTSPIADSNIQDLI